MLKVFGRVGLVLALSATSLVGLVQTAQATGGDVFARGVRYCADTYTGHPNAFGSSPAEWVVDLNFPGDAGTPLYAPAAGSITASWDGKGGNVATWTSADGTEKLLMAHLAAITKTGRVNAGERFGTLGNTGSNTTGAHLHVARAVNGRPQPVVLSGVTLQPLKNRAASTYGVCTSANTYTSQGPLTAPASAPTTGTRSYARTIVQWDGDTKAQKTAWFVTPDNKRLWIPDTATYWCLKNQGAAGPVRLPAGTLDALPDQKGIWAGCGDTLPVNRALRRNMYLQSGDGRYKLWMQGDGNLVLYGPSGRALWANNRFTSEFVIMQGDGNLVTYGASGADWASHTAGRSGARLIVQNDGNVVIYVGSQAVWSTRTAGRS